MTSAGVAAARSPGVGQWTIQSRQIRSTRATGVCCSMTSLTSTAHAPTPGWRQGRSRAAVAYQSTITSPTARAAAGAGPGGIGTGERVTGVQSAVLPARRAMSPEELPEHYGSRSVAPGRPAERGRLLAPAPRRAGRRAGRSRRPLLARRRPSEPGGRWRYLRGVGPPLDGARRPDAGAGPGRALGHRAAHADPAASRRGHEGGAEADGSPGTCGRRAVHG